MNLMKLMAPLVAAGLLLASGCGDSDDDTSKNAAGNGVDRAFAQQMLPHHRSAVAMARVAQARGTSAFVKTLAANIVRTQTEEITTLAAADKRLARARVAAGKLGVDEHMMGMDGDVAELKTADPFDPAFLTMMIPHHEGAIEMARAEQAKGSDAELKELAGQIISAQQKEITQMREHTADDAHSDHMG